MDIASSTVASPVAVLTNRQSALDDTYDSLRSGSIAPALDDLFDDLAFRREDEPAAWGSYAATCRHHPICGLLHQDPFTYRAFSKPRGYAGDAVMMDYI